MTEKKFVVTKEMLDSENFYKGESLSFDGHIEISGGLGWVRFRKSVSASLSIVVAAGSGIEAGEGIKARLGIEAGLGIKAGWGIEAGWGIKAIFISVRLRIFAGLCMWKVPTEKEMEINAEIRSGTVCYGNVVSEKAGGKKP